MLSPYQTGRTSVEEEVQVVQALIVAGCEILLAPLKHVMLQAVPQQGLMTRREVSGKRFQVRLVLCLTHKRLQSLKRAAKDQASLELIYVWHAVLKGFAVGSACVPGIHYIADTGPNRLAQLLSANTCCLVVDHRQGGKTTLAALAAGQLQLQLEPCYVVTLSGVKVILTCRIFPRSRHSDFAASQMSL